MLAEMDDAPGGANQRGAAAAIKREHRLGLRALPRRLSTSQAELRMTGKLELRVEFLARDHTPRQPLPFLMRAAAPIAR